MILTRDYNRGEYEIHSYIPGKIEVNEDFYEKSLIINSSSLLPWSPQSIHDLTEKDLEIIFSLKPEIVLLGTGSELIFPDQKLVRKFAERGLGLEVMDTGAACRTFNVLMSESRNVVAALIIK